MKPKILIGLILILILAASPLFAQSRGGQAWRGMRPADSACWQNPEFGATEEQLKSLEEVHRSYLREIGRYRNQYVGESHELRSLLSSPKPDTHRVMEKQDSLSSLQKKIDEISLEHFLKARQIFTQDQISRLPSGCSLGFTYGAATGLDWRRGQGRGWGRGR
jgi:Spy/CpxP family protein refolding chaperone